MFTDNWQVVPGEVATAVKMSQLGANDDYLKEGLDSAVAPGTFAAFAGNTAPTGWLVCDGAAVSRTTYAELFAVLGTSRGAGNGSTTFNLPNYKGRSIIGRDSGDTDFNTVGKTYGSKNVTMSVANLAPHNHTGVTDPNGHHTHGYLQPPNQKILPIHGSGDANHGFNDGRYAAQTDGAGNHQHSFTTSTTGSATPMSVVHPVGVETIIIKY